MSNQAVPSKAEEIAVHRVKDRDGGVIARVFRGGPKYFALMCHGEVVHGPFDDIRDAEEDARAWIQACEALSMWSSMIDS